MRLRQLRGLIKLSMFVTFSMSLSYKQFYWHRILNPANHFLIYSQYLSLFQADKELPLVSCRQFVKNVPDLFWISSMNPRLNLMQQRLQPFLVEKPDQTFLHLENFRCFYKFLLQKLWTASTPLIFQREKHDQLFQPPQPLLLPLPIAPRSLCVLNRSTSYVLLFASHLTVSLFQLCLYLACHRLCKKYQQQNHKIFWHRPNLVSHPAVSQSLQDIWNRYKACQVCLSRQDY